jgi:hypothetical protein
MLTDLFVNMHEIANPEEARVQAVALQQLVVALGARESDKRSRIWSAVRPLAFCLWLSSAEASTREPSESHGAL